MYSVTAGIDEQEKIIEKKHDSLTQQLFFVEYWECVFVRSHTSRTRLLQWVNLIRAKPALVRNQLPAAILSRLVGIRTYVRSRVSSAHHIH